VDDFAVSVVAQFLDDLCAGVGVFRHADRNSKPLNLDLRLSQLTYCPYLSANLVNWHPTLRFITNKYGKYEIGGLNLRWVLIDHVFLPTMEYGSCTSCQSPWKYVCISADGYFPFSRVSREENLFVGFKCCAILQKSRTQIWANRVATGLSSWVCVRMWKCLNVSDNHIINSSECKMFW
jgi:hypothetical protein